VVLETRILVVEDERTPASFMEQGLRAEGHAVTVCHDGESGEAAALTGDYALVLLDLLCPARPASTCLERSARMPEPASDRADRARSRRAERGLDRGAND
jgi:DNA-binding response OmpR family regulator